MKINITFNGTSHDIATDSTITQALAVLTIASNTEANKFVIALNQTFVPRSQYSTTQLQNNDAIELLSPMAGG